MSVAGIQRSGTVLKQMIFKSEENIKLDFLSHHLDVEMSCVNTKRPLSMLNLCETLNYRRAYSVGAQIAFARTFCSKSICHISIHPREFYCVMIN